MHPIKNHHNSFLSISFIFLCRWLIILFISIDVILITILIICISELFSDCLLFRNTSMTRQPIYQAWLTLVWSWRILKSEYHLSWSRTRNMAITRTCSENSQSHSPHNQLSHNVHLANIGLKMLNQMESSDK